LRVYQFYFGVFCRDTEIEPHLELFFLEPGIYLGFWCRLFSDLTEPYFAPAKFVSVEMTVEQLALALSDDYPTTLTFLAHAPGEHYVFRNVVIFERISA